MAETKRTSTDLWTNLFQDGQTKGSINEQDVRDFIASLILPYGGCSMEDNSTATTINTLDVYEAIGGTYTADSSLVEFTVSSAGLYTYTGTPDRYIVAVGFVTFETAANDKDIRFKWHHEGTTELQACTEQRIGTSTDRQSVMVIGRTTMSTNETLQLKVANSTDTANCTAVHVSSFVFGKLV